MNRSQSFPIVPGNRSGQSFPFPPLRGTERFERVQLRGGPVLPIEPIALAIDLEARGFGLTSDADVTGPLDRLTDDDRAAVARWKPELRAIVAYCAQVEVPACQ
jgi:hypothetical protein